MREDEEGHVRWIGLACVCAFVVVLTAFGLKAGPGGPVSIAPPHPSSGPVTAEPRTRTVLEPIRADEPEGTAPATRMVRGSNHAVLNVFADRVPGRAIIVAAIDNLVKGSSGQALQNLNLMLRLPETMGLEQGPLFP